MSLTVNPLLSPTGDLFFSSTFDGGLIERGRGKGREKGLFNFSEMYQREEGFSRTDLWLPDAILLFLTIRKW